MLGYLHNPVAGLNSSDHFVGLFHIMLGLICWLEHDKNPLFGPFLLLQHHCIEHKVLNSQVRGEVNSSQDKFLNSSFAFQI